MVGGEIRGVLRATEQVVLHATARVLADVFTPTLVMEDGALLEGRVTMEEVKKKFRKSENDS